MQTAAGRQRAHLQQFSPNRPGGAARVAAGQEDEDRRSPPKPRYHAKSTVDDRDASSDQGNAQGSWYDTDDYSEGGFEMYEEAEQIAPGNGVRGQH